ncbi:MAG: hypothetical protein MZW92_75720 [Comamonadaceae bacterium]|nr:hypothetical protein [Comamonadaceae bacterium]
MPATWTGRHAAGLSAWRACRTLRASCAAAVTRACALARRLLALRLSLPGAGRAAGHLHVRRRARAARRYRTPAAARAASASTSQPVADRAGAARAGRGARRRRRPSARRCRRRDSRGRRRRRSARATATARRILEDELAGARKSALARAAAAEFNDGEPERARRRAQLRSATWTASQRLQGRHRAQPRATSPRCSANSRCCRKLAPRVAAAGALPPTARRDRMRADPRAVAGRDAALRRARPAGHRRAAARRRRRVAVRQRGRRDAARHVAQARWSGRRLRRVRRRRRCSTAALDARSGNAARRRSDCELRRGCRASRLPVHVHRRRRSTRAGARCCIEMLPRSSSRLRHRPRGARCSSLAQANQRADAQPGARDQEPAGRHPRRGAAARDGAATPSS